MLMPLPKSLNAATRCTGDGSSPSTTGILSRNQAAAGPGVRKSPSTKRNSTAATWYQASPGGNAG